MGANEFRYRLRKQMDKVVAEGGATCHCIPAI